MIKFLKESEGEVVYMSTESVILEEILGDFTRFLRGIGYGIPDNETLELVFTPEVEK